MKKLIITLLICPIIFVFLSVPLSYAYSCKVMQLTSPIHSKTLLEDKRPTFSWQPVEGAVKYHIQIADFKFPEGTFRWELCLVNDSEVTSTSYQPPSDLGYGKFYWRVRAMIYPDERGMYGWCPWGRTENFNTISRPRVILNAPENGSRIATLRPEFRYYSVEGTGDRIQVATDPSFSNIILDQVTRESDRSSSLPCPMDLEYGRTYYWRGRIESWWRSEEFGLPMPSEWSQVSNFSVYAPVPPKVYLTSPISGELVGSSVTFTWNPAPTASEYMLIISDKEDFSTTALRLFSNTNSVSATLRFADGEFYWRARASNTGGYGEWSDSRPFRKTSRVPTPVTLEEPMDRATVNTQTPIFRWQRRSGAEYGNFQLQISRASDFSTTVVNKEDIREDSSIMSSPSTLATNTTYYWRMRQNSPAGWGRWSEARSLFVSPILASSARVELRSPSNGQEIDDVRVGFSWRALSTGCSRYDLQIANDASFADTVKELVPSGTSEYIWLEQEKTYYWRVRAEDDRGWGLWSAVWNMKIRSAGLGGMEVYNPKGKITTTRPEFTWKGSSETRSPRYHIQVSTNPNMSNPIIDYDNLYQTNYTPYQNLVVGYQYYWRIRKKREESESWWPWSPIANFWIELAFTPIMLTKPENNVSLRTPKPSFSWKQGEASTGISKFELEIADHRDFSTTVLKTEIKDTERLHSSGTDECSYLCPQDLRDGTYFWRVRQKPNDTRENWGAWSEARSFTVDVTPPQIRIISPAQTKITSSVIPATVNVSCEVIDRGTGVDRVEFYLSGRKVAERNRAYEGSIYIGEIAGLNEGRNMISIKAYDKSGRTGNNAHASLVLEVERVMGIKKPATIPKEPIKRKDLVPMTPKPGMSKEKLPPK